MPENEKDLAQEQELEVTELEDVAGGAIALEESPNNCDCTNPGCNQCD